MNKSLDVCGIGNGLVDIFLDVEESEFATLGFERGTMRLVEADEQAELLKRHEGRSPGLVSGGSVSNSTIAVAQLGGKSALLCSLGDDRYGTFFRKECDELGVVVPSQFTPGATTGTCLSIVTPDAERTMRTCLAVSADLGPEHVHPETVSKSKWLFVEGYLFANPKNGPAAVKEAIRIAKESGTQVAITCSEPWVVTAFSGPLQEALGQADLVFCNEEEALALSGKATIQEAGEALKKQLSKVVITGGPQGAYLWWDEKMEHVQAYPCQPRDLTGAGDMFAGAFLYGVTHGYAASDAASRANFLAKLVISQVGARLRGDVAGHWKAPR